MKKDFSIEFVSFWVNVASIPSFVVYDLGKTYWLDLPALSIRFLHLQWKTWTKGDILWNNNEIDQKHKSESLGQNAEDPSKVKSELCVASALWSLTVKFT